MQQAVVAACACALAFVAAPARAASPAPAPATATAPPLTSTPLPPALQALDQKMERLQIAGESLVQSSRTTVTSAILHGIGPHARLLRHVTHSVRGTITEVSFAPLQGIMKNARTGQPQAIALGSNFYLYLGSKASDRHLAPWVHFGEPRSSAFNLLPFAGNASENARAGGSGPFAGLADLLATAVGVAAAGSSIVEAQQVSEFTMTVRPQKLSGDSTVKAFAKALGVEPAERLEVFFSDTGLPLRVRTRSASHIAQFSSVSTDTTEVSALNPIFTVTAPPAIQTIPAAAFEKQLGSFFGGLLHAATKSESGTAAPRGKSKQ